MKREELKRLMLVDDNATDRFIHRKLLEISGLGDKVIEFTNGRDGLNYLRESKDQSEDLPQVILIDVLMPEMNGFDFLIHLEAFIDELALRPIIFMLSSTDDESDLRQARNSPIVEKLLRKPFSPEALLHALGRIG